MTNTGEKKRQTAARRRATAAAKPEEPTTAPEQLNAVIVARVEDGESVCYPVSTIGDVKPDQVEFMLKMALKAVREQHGFID